MNAIIAPFDLPLTSDVRRLVADLMTDLEAIPDHRDRLLATVGDGNSPEDAADFARDHAVWLRRLGILGDRIPSAQTLRRLLRRS